MVKKIKLHSIGNQENFNFYIFDKKKEVFNILNDILNKIDAKFYDYDQNNENINMEKISMEKMKDVHWSTTAIGRKSRVDIYFGDKKMFLVINCPQDTRLKFNEELFKIAEMPGSKKIKKTKHKKWQNKNH